MLPLLSPAFHFRLKLVQQDENKILFRLKNALLKLKGTADVIYLHIDMDVLETKQGKPNHLAAAGGLPTHIVLKAIRTIKMHFNIKGCAIASYDPALDEGNSVLNAGIKIIKTIVESKNQNKNPQIP